MKVTELTMKREDLKIEGDRNLHSYTFSDTEGKTVEPEPTLPPVAPKAEGGNLNPKEGENRKG